MDFMDLGTQNLRTCGGLKSGAGTSIERWQTPSLQAWRLGGLDGWIQEALKAGGSDPGALEAGWLACWLEGLDWIRLDASGCWIGVGGGIG
jgi:hypothetical protein